MCLTDSGGVAVHAAVAMGRGRAGDWADDSRPSQALCGLVLMWAPPWLETPSRGPTLHHNQARDCRKRHLILFLKKSGLHFDLP